MHTNRCSIEVTCDVPRFVLVALVVVAYIVTLGVTSTAAATSPRCQVKNTDTGANFGRIQRAVRVAKPRQHLTVKGVCHGGTVIDKRLAIKGVPTLKTGKPTLDGDGKARVLVVSKGVKITVKNLAVVRGRWGYDPSGAPGPGGAIVNRGDLTLFDVVVRDTDDLRAIYNEGVLRMFGKSLVRDNQATGVVNNGRLILGGTTRVVGNALYGIRNTGTVVMNGRSNVGRNGSWEWVPAIWNKGTFTMNDASSLTDNKRGAVENSGTFTMNDASSIHHNADAGLVKWCQGPEGWGAGVENRGTLVMNDRSSIHHNRVKPGSAFPCYDDLVTGSPGLGGGVHNVGTLKMQGSSSIHDNTAEGSGQGPGQGGGLYSRGGTLIGVKCGSPSPNVYGNTPDDCHIE